MPNDGGYRSAISDAKALGLPLWVGEFGNNPQDDDTILRTHYTLQDKYLLGGTLWLWKENANDVNGSVFWGVYGKPFGRGTPQPKRILLTSRATPMATAGPVYKVRHEPGDREVYVQALCGGASWRGLARAAVIYLSTA